MSDAYIVRRGKIIQGGGGFDPNGAALKVVTSTGCSVTVIGTGYSQTHQDGDGFPRSDDANVTEHFFSIPASAFGNFSVTATNNYGSNFKTIEDINTAGRVYEVLISAPNVILNNVFGLQDGITFKTYYGNQPTYDSDYRELTFFGNSGRTDYGWSCDTVNTFDVIPYNSLVIKGRMRGNAQYIQHNGVIFALTNKDGVQETSSTVYLSDTLIIDLTLPITDVRKSPFKIKFYGDGDYVSDHIIKAPTLILTDLVFEGGAS